jgi:hypothetical protein
VDDTRREQLIGEFYAMLFTAHGDSHIDPPSATLFTTFTIMSLLKVAGAFAITGIGSAIIAVVIGAAGFGIWTLLKAGKVAGADVTAPAEVKA